MTKNGFTAIEIVIALAVVVIISIIAVPRFMNVLRKSEEGATKSALGALRGAIAMYYGDHEGNYPSAEIVKELTENGKYIQEIPYASCPPYHKKSNKIYVGDFEKNKNLGGWAYKEDDAEDGTGRVKGQIWVNSANQDSKGNIWSEL
ncbi:MAG: type II secretion system GspH family protein [Endomicrobium sp.]|jgi:prepilin-type N-terminal cleavage/methylation domain-containing protein|nr:type II secretion system GspH family protein [Endomicrobium sp.]